MSRKKYIIEKDYADDDFKTRKWSDTILKRHILKEKILHIQTRQLGYYVRKKN